MDINVKERFAKIMGRDLSDIETLFDGFSSVIRENLTEMNSIALPGFGTFIPEKKDEHVKEEHGERVLYPPEIIVKFCSSALLRRKIIEKEEL